MLWLVPLWIKLCAALQTELQDRTLLIGCGSCRAAAFNAPIAGVLFAIEFLLVDVSIAAFTQS
jgi:H+/Cl- antiporter ClcA